MLVKILAFTYRNWIFAKRNLFTFFELLFWPVVSLVSMGLMSGFLKLDQNLLNFVLTGAITAGTIQVATLDVAYGLLYDVWSKSIKHTFLAPIEHFHFIIGSWLVGIIRGIIIFAFMAVFSYYAFGFEIPSYKIATIFMLGVFLNALIMGMVICFLITLYGQRVEIVAWAFATLVMLICGIYYPVSQLPSFFQLLAEMIPLTYFLEYFRSGYGFTPVLTHLLLKGFVMSFAYIGLIMIAINWAYQRSRKNGIIMRLSE